MSGINPNASAIDIAKHLLTLIPSSSKMSDELDNFAYGTFLALPEDREQHLRQFASQRHGYWHT